MKPNQDKKEPNEPDSQRDKQNAKDSHMTNDHMMNILLQSVDASYRKGQMEEVIVVEKRQKLSLEDYSTDSDDETTSDHVTSDHVTSDHLSSDHVTSDHVTSDHVPITSKDKLYRAMNYWCTSRTRDWLTLYLDNRGKGEEMVMGGGCEREEERSKDGDTVFLPPVHGIETSQIQKNVFLCQMKAK